MGPPLETNGEGSPYLCNYGAWGSFVSGALAKNGFGTFSA